MTPGFETLAQLRWQFIQRESLKASMSRYEAYLKAKYEGRVAYDLPLQDWALMQVMIYKVNRMLRKNGQAKFGIIVDPTKETVTEEFRLLWPNGFYPWRN